MATVYVKVGYLVDEDGTRHDQGAAIEVASTTDVEKANLQRLVDYGIVTATRPEDSSEPKAGKGK